MKKLLRGAIALAAIAGVGYVIYREVLTDEARSSLHKMVEVVKDSYDRVNEVISSVRGDVMTDEVPLPNVQATMKQWKDMGY